MKIKTNIKSGTILTYNLSAACGSFVGTVSCGSIVLSASRGDATGDCNLLYY